MKIVISKKIFNLGVGIILIGSFGLAPVSFAKERNATSTERERGKRQERREEKTTICTNLAELEAKFDAKVEKRLTKLEEKRKKRVEDLTDKREARERKRLEHQGKWDKNLEEHFAKLKERAKTSEQQQAVAVFIAAIRAAKEKRQEAIEAAIKTFRQGMDKALAERKAKVDDARKAFLAAKEGVVSQATSACDSSDDPKAVRKELKERLQAAQEKFRRELKGIEKFSVQVAGLVEAREEAFRVAKQGFQEAVKEAKLKLQAAFGEVEEAAEAEEENDQE